MIHIVDYGAGNLYNVQRAIEHLGYDTMICDSPDPLANANVMVLPGVGAFGASMAALNDRGLSDAIRAHIAAKKPFIGICVGFQVLFSESEEAPGVPGLGVLEGTARRFSHDLTVPHMGWNTITTHHDPLGLSTSLGADPSVYFVHSYYIETSNSDMVWLTTPYGSDFVSAVQHESIVAMQFHPEKSGRVGLGLLERIFRTLSNS